jgi:hypothetical protein
MTMRTIEAEATITEAGTLVVPVSQDLLPGSYHVVIVIDASRTDVDIGATMPEDHQVLLDLAGTWAGDDLDERLAEVYASRSPIEAT